MNPPDIDAVLVDHDPQVRHALRSALLRGWRAIGAQARVRAFASASAALDNLRKEHADVVLADYRLSGVDGVELLRQARQLLPSSSRILLSDAADFTFLLRAVNPDAVARVLLKPWIDEELLGAVRQGLELGRLRGEHAAMAEQVRQQRGAAALPAPDLQPSVGAPP